MINYIDVGKRIKKLRESKKISQEELANKIGKTVRYIRQIEIGFKPGDDESLQIMVDLALALDTSLDYLAHGTENVPSLKERIHKRYNVQ